jgi:chloramphenicol 3-O phosphotransferase
VGTDVIVLNGGSSAGKSSIARCLQGVLRRPWLTFGVDDLLVAMPPATENAEDGITFAPDGLIAVGPEFRRLEAAWHAGLAAMAAAGVGIIVDEVFLGGASSQARLDDALVGLTVLWVAVHCDPDVATAREADRPDRIVGMAASQARVVHDGVRYDLQVDTTRTSAMDCALAISAHVVA